MINNEGGDERLIFTGRKADGGHPAENLQTNEILCPCRLYKFSASRETFGFPILAQLNKDNIYLF